MSEKKRRDITLGEMQDECKKRETRCGINSDNPCPYDKICDAVSPNGFSTDGNGIGAVFPCHWNLTDPPRFNEQQMAFLRGWYEIGARDIYRGGTLVSFGKVIMAQVHDKEVLEMFRDGETLDLAELLGKDGK